MSNPDEFPLPVDDSGEHAAVDDRKFEPERPNRNRESKAAPSAKASDRLRRPQLTPPAQKVAARRPGLQARSPSAEEPALPDVGDIGDMLESYSGAMRSVLDVEPDDSAEASEDLELDFAAMPDRMKRTAMARGMSDLSEMSRQSSNSRTRTPFSSTPVAPGTAIVTDRAGMSKRERRRRRKSTSENRALVSPDIAGHLKAGDTEKSYEVKRSKKGLFIVSGIFLLIFGGIYAFQWQSKRAAIAELKEPLEALYEVRGPLYQQLAAQIDANQAPANDFCPRLEGASTDATFFFDGLGPAGLPTENFVIRELTRLDSSGSTDSGESSLAAIRSSIDALGSAVVYVRAQAWRAPSLLGGDVSTSGRGYGNIQPGYLIGDAFVGDATSNLAVCSFRFFASSSTLVRRSQGAERDLQADYLQQIHEGIEAGIRGMRANPGVRSGRYRQTTPPTGF